MQTSRRPRRSYYNARSILQTVLIGITSVTLYLSISHILFSHSSSSLIDTQHQYDGNTSPLRTSGNKGNPQIINILPTWQNDITKISNADQQNIISNNNITVINNPNNQRREHALFHMPLEIATLEDTFVYLQQQAICQNSPIFVTMANVGSDLYWQMIENFIYTMERYNILPCAMMICVSDLLCVQKCKENDFPCFNYNHIPLPNSEIIPHTMEQIAHLKLYHVPKALAKGVDIFTLDLDVGFYDNPMTLISNYKSSVADTFVQEDVVFIMHRSVARWKEWWTEPMPNIGMMLCKGNQQNVDMFAKAWADYLAINKPIKHNPGKDQNKVVESMKISHRERGFQWEYFPNSSAVLIDKLYKFVNLSIELGGEVAQEILSSMNPPTVAIHTTCYEQRTKVMGLKALSAFYTPQYYNMQRLTITKPLIYYDLIQMNQEVQTLSYLAYISGRSLIVPNILGPNSVRAGGVYRNRKLWPGFRVLYTTSPAIIEVLEPAYYWRTAQLTTNQEPLPKILIFESTVTLSDIESRLRNEVYPRIILHIKSIHSKETDEQIIQRLTTWAMNSVGIYDEYEIEKSRYSRIPTFTDRNHVGYKKIHNRVGACSNIFVPYRGNRSCFEVCEQPF